MLATERRYGKGEQFYKFLWHGSKELEKDYLQRLVPLKHEEKGKKENVSQINSGVHWVLESSEIQELNTNIKHKWGTGRASPETIAAEDWAVLFSALSLTGLPGLLRVDLKVSILELFPSKTLQKIPCWVYACTRKTYMSEEFGLVNSDSPSTVSTTQNKLAEIWV